jgi:hypothetical protein
MFKKLLNTCFVFGLNLLLFRNEYSGHLIGSDQLSENDSLNKKVKDLASRMGISRPLLICKSTDTNSTAKGCNLYPFNGKIYLNEEDESGVIAHELAHIKNNDLLYDMLFRATMSSFIYCSHLKFKLQMSLLVLSIPLSKFIYTSYAERSADTYSISYLNNYELARMSSYFMIHNIAYKHLFFIKRLLDPHGNSLTRAKKYYGYIENTLEIDYYVIKDDITSAMDNDLMNTFIHYMNDGNNKYFFVDTTKVVYNIDEDIIYVYSYDEKKCELHMDNKRLNITKINMKN